MLVMAASSPAAGIPATLVIPAMMMALMTRATTRPLHHRPAMMINPHRMAIHLPFLLQRPARAGCARRRRQRPRQGLTGFSIGVYPWVTQDAGRQ